MAENIGKFQVIDHLGNGHFGDVFLCYDPFLLKERAIKVIRVPDPARLVTAIKEGRTLDICRHKHIVELKEVDTAIFRGEPVLIIVMEYLSKGSIQRHIEKRFISVKESCKIIQESLLGLEHAHNGNFLHRDIKPGNILFGYQNEAKLSDFGLSINYQSDGSDLRGYRPHQPLEVIEGQMMDKLSDVYGMGITLYRLLNNTNQLTFNFRSIDEWRKAVKKDLFPPRVYLTHVPDRVAKVTNKSMHKDKDKRFKSCTDFRQAIEKMKFNIDWIMIDADQWRGNNNSDFFELTKLKARQGWKIDMRRNGRRDNNNCHTNLTDAQVDSEFVRIINETTLQ